MPREAPPLVEDARTVELPRHERDYGVVIAAEGAADAPFAIARVFTVCAPVDSMRGDHAHRQCRQFMFCPRGAVDVGLDDGANRKRFRLARDNLALYVPAMIWNVVSFLAPETVLVVLCDQPFSEDDYIRDYDLYRRERGEKRP